MLQKKHRGRIIGAVVSIAISLTIILGAGWLFLNRQFVADQVTVWSFQPSAAVESIEQRIKLTDEGRFYFYVTQPVVAGADSFNVDCPRQEPESPILGCYTMGKMFIFDIKNSELDGIKEVTAAHEMLHAVWERMSEPEQARLSALLRTAYEQNTNDELASRMAYYERTQPGDFFNELHSILPTEFATLSPELEDHYAAFFQDRQLIVLLNEQYSSVFNSIVDQINGLYDEITTLGANIESDRSVYNDRVNSLDGAIANFNRRADSGNFTTIGQFNNERASLVNQTTNLEVFGSQISANIDRYNTLLAQYEAVALRLESLNRSIDSIADLQQAPSL